MKKFLAIIFLLSFIILSEPVFAHCDRHVPHRYKDSPKVLRQAGYIRTTSVRNPYEISYTAPSGLNYKVATSFNYKTPPAAVYNRGVR